MTGSQSSSEHLPGHGRERHGKCSCPNRRVLALTGRGVVTATPPPFLVCRERDGPSLTRYGSPRSRPVSPQGAAGGEPPRAGPGGSGPHAGGQCPPSPRGTPKPRPAEVPHRPMPCPTRRAESPRDPGEQRRDPAARTDRWTGVGPRPPHVHRDLSQSVHDFLPACRGESSRERVQSLRSPSAACAHRHGRCVARARKPSPGPPCSSPQSRSRCAPQGAGGQCVPRGL